MSLFTYFLKSELNRWRNGIRASWANLRYSYAVRPLRTRIRKFGLNYLFFGFWKRWSREKQAQEHINKYQAAITQKQLLCSHLKGQRHFSMGVLKPRTILPKDYNVSLHTFIHNRKRVICNACKRIWWEGEPGWNEALRMVQCSNNKSSSSEIPGTVLRGDFSWKPSIKSSFWVRVLRRLKNNYASFRAWVGKS